MLEIKHAFVTHNNKQKNFMIVVSGFFVTIITSLGLFFFFPFSIPNKMLFALIIGFVSALLWLKLALGLEICIQIGIKGKTKIFNLLLFFALSLFMVLVVTGFNQIDIFLTGPLYFVNAYAVILLIFYLPGYLIVSRLDRSIMSRAEKHVFSVLLSMFITGTAGLLSLKSRDIITYSWIAFSVVMLIIIGSIVIQLILSEKHVEGYSPTGTKEKLNLLDLSILFTTALFLLLVYSVFHEALWTSPLPLVSDEPFHVGLMIKLLSGMASWQETLIGSFIGYPYLFHLSMDIGVIFSNLPAVEFLILTSILLIPLPTVAFYSLAKRLVKDSDRAIVSVVLFSFLSGFGWIAALAAYGMNTEILVIYGASVYTNDIIFSTWLPIIVAPYLIDLTIFFFVLNFATRKDISTKSLVLLLIPLLTLGILVHFEKIIFLTIIFCCLTLLQNHRERAFRVKEIGTAIIFSLIVVQVWEIYAPMRFYTTTYLLPMILLLIGAVFIILYSSIMEKVNKKGLGILLDDSKKIAILFAITYTIIMIYEMVIGLLPGPSAAVIPLYLIPIKLGWLTLFMAIWFLKHIRKEKQIIKILTMIVFCVLFVELLLFHTPFEIYRLGGTYIGEFRFFRDITWPILSIASSLGVISLFRNKVPIDILQLPPDFRKVIISGFVIGLVISTGSFSSMLKVEYQANYSDINQSMYGTIEFLRDMSFPSDAAIFSDTSMALSIFAATGMMTYSPQTEIFGEILSSSTDLSSVLFILKYLNIGYVVTSVSAHGTALIDVTSISELLYIDNYYSIFELPNLSSPNYYSKTALITQDLTPSMASFLGENISNLWEDDFESASGWILSELSGQNIHYSISETENSSLQFICESSAQQKMVVFFQKMLDNPVPLTENIRFWFRFRTKSTSTLVVHIIFEDGTSINAERLGSLYFQEHEWTWINYKIPRLVGKITGIRVGITNRLHIEDTEVKVELDYACLVYSNPYSDYLQISLASSCIDFYTTYPMDYQMCKKAEILLVLENSNQSTPSYITQELAIGKQVFMIGNIYDSNWIRQFTNVTLFNQTTQISSINRNELIYNIPTFEIKRYSISEGNVTAWFSGDQDIPFIVSLPIEGNGSLKFINLLPLLNFSRELASQAERVSLTTIFHNIFIEMMNLTQSYEMEREFYIKSTKTITMSGNINIICSTLLFENSSLFAEPNDETCKLSISGRIQISTCGFGHVAIFFERGSQVLINGYSFTESMDNHYVIAAPIEIGGEGEIEYSRLSSGSPFPIVLYNVEYNISGRFFFSRLHITNTAILLLPEILAGFNW